jgi:hypothetical protein
MTKERARANTPGMTRRNLLAALPVSGLAAALPQVAPAATPDPVVVAYQEWLAARREWRELSELPGNEDFDDPRSLAADEHERVAMFAMLQNDPTSLEGIGALAALLWSDISHGCTDPSQFKHHPNFIECLTVEAIWKACTGQDGYPEV